MLLNLQDQRAYCCAREKKKKRNRDILLSSHFKMYFLYIYSELSIQKTQRQLEACTLITHRPRPGHTSCLTSVFSCCPPEAPRTHGDHFMQSYVFSFFFLTQPCSFSPITLLHSHVSSAFLKLLCILLFKPHSPRMFRVL